MTIAKGPDGMVKVTFNLSRADFDQFFRHCITERWAMSAYARTSVMQSVEADQRDKIEVAA